MSLTVQNEIQRSLAAIVITDAVGFSRWMSQDEDTALSIINHDLQFISELCERFQGKILKTTGDGVLMYFISAVQAVSCVVEMQNHFAALAQEDQKNKHFVHRVGVHLGDIFFNNEDMMGSAVNIAARLEAEAKPGGICMSQVVYEVVRSRLKLEASYAGELSLKNIDDYVSAYHVAPVNTQQPQDSIGFSPMAVPFIAPLSDTLNTLSVHPEVDRIKSLLYAVHRASGEKDATVLAGSSLKLLLESLTDSHDTLNKCRASLYQTVSTLQPQEEYFAAADVIIESLQDFYGEQDDIPQMDIFRPAKPSLNPQRAILHKTIADHLAQEDDCISIKKILYCACCGQWERYHDRLDAIPMLSMIQELHKQHSALETLGKRLQAILSEYELEGSYYTTISDKIVAACGILYAKREMPITPLENKAISTVLIG